MMYHRFVQQQGRIHPENEGMLSVGTNLLREQKRIRRWFKRYQNQKPPWLSEQQEVELEEFISWFNCHLSVPRKFIIKLRKGESSGLFWFKDSAKEYIDKSRQMLNFFNKQLKLPMFNLVSDDPGDILIEDAYQVVARFSRRSKWYVRRKV